MTNADKFKSLFGLYATELWSKSEKEFLEWLNADANLQPNLQLSCNIATDCISRQDAIDEIDEWIKAFRENGHKESAADACLIQDGIIQLPSTQLIKSDIIQCGYCTHHVPPAYCKENDGIWRPFDYCSKAERKKNEYDIQTGCD